MSLINQLLTTTELAQPLSPDQAEALAAELGRIAGLSVIGPAAWTLTHFAGLPGVPTPRIFGVIAVWFIGFVFVAQLEHQRRRSEGAHTDA